MTRRAAVIVGAVGALVLSACVGSTEPATDVTYSGATLNARGTANNGAAVSYFEYWADNAPTRRLRGGLRNWPAGASGAFSHTVGSLYQNTTYHFRLCGRDADAGSDVCAQTRTFTTPFASRDAVKGRWFAFPEDFAPTGTINATAGPPGRPPTGSLDYKPNGNSGDSFTGFVTCLIVSGERAAVGAVGQATDRSGVQRPATALVTIIENEPEFQDVVRATLSPGSTPPACATATYPTVDDGVLSNSLVVYDAP